MQRCESEPDVLTVYRGSFTHNAFVTDAREKLSTIDCSHYLVTHDDVLLHPALDENNLLDALGVCGQEGYIPYLAPTPNDIGDWGHWVGPLWRLSSPRNYLSGTGVDSLTTLLSQLPSQSYAASKMAPFGAPAQTTFNYSDGSLHKTGSLDRFKSFYGSHDVEDGEFMKAYLGQMFGPKEDGRRIQIPYPFVYAGFGGDFVLIPKSKFLDFAHYSGVLAAAGVFCEAAHPTALLLACDHVRVAPQPFLDYVWMGPPMDPYEMIARMRADPNLIAAHPLKLSTIHDKEALVQALRKAKTLAIAPALSPRPSSDTRIRRIVEALEPGFSPSAYLAANPDLGPNHDALAHYLQHGRVEKRPTRP